jgi:hypothetical protein
LLRWPLDSKLFENNLRLLSKDQSIGKSDVKYSTKDLQKE